MCARDLGKDSKTTCTTDEFIAGIDGLLTAIQTALHDRASAFLQNNVTDVASLAAARDFFVAGTPGFIRTDAALLEDPACAALRKDFSVTPRCLPFADGGTKVIFGRSY